MSEVQGSAAPAAASPVAPHSNSTGNQSGAVHSSNEKTDGASPSKGLGGSGKGSENNLQPGSPVDGKSATGKPDLADKAAKAVEQGRELTQKDLTTPVTRIVNGQKVTKTLNDWINASQLEQASHQRFQQAQALAKQAQQLIYIAQNDPAQFMKITGKDPTEFSQQQLAAWLEEQQLSDTERELKRYKQKEKDEEERQKSDTLRKQHEAQQAKDTSDYNQMVKESLEAWKESGLPDDPYWGQRMAAEVARHQSQGIPLTWKEAASIVKHDWTTSNQRILDSFQNVGELANFLGEKVLKKLREFEIARITSKQASGLSSSQSKRPGNSPASQQNKSQPKFVNQRDYDAYWAKLGHNG